MTDWTQALSPFQAILDYERANTIPIGWINYSIQSTSPNGAWHRLERGELRPDEGFFTSFKRDLERPDLWRAFIDRLRKRDQNITTAATATIPPVPRIDAKGLFWEMMQLAQRPDPYIYPALSNLGQSGQFVLGALSNTVILPGGEENEGPDNIKNKFDFFISSAHVGLRKPDPRIYALALKSMNEAAKTKGLDPIEADDIVFLDDIGINLKSAREMGFRTIKVNLGRAADSVRELEALTGLALLDEKSRL